MSNAKQALPDWANQMRKVFRSGSISQFILHGAIFDLIPYTGADGTTQLMGLKQFLEQVMLQPFDVVVRYDRGTGIRVVKGLEQVHRFLKTYDEFNGTAYAKSPASIPRQPDVALWVLDRLLDWCTQHSVIEGNALVRKPFRLAVIVDYVQYVAPAGGSLQMSTNYGNSVIRLLDWANDPALTEANALTLLLTENLADVNASISNNPYSAKLHVPLPKVDELTRFIEILAERDPILAKHLKLDASVVASRTVGLSRVNLRNALMLAARNGIDIDSEYLAGKRRELIEKECRGLLDFIESTHTLDEVAGHTEARKWLREDTALLKAGNLRSIPMGYLFCGRIGTGKTWLTTCWAGEI
ncbi:MAG: hypothetical protein ACI9WU_004555, partial [Myxococcota bacterium]